MNNKLVDLNDYNRGFKDGLQSAKKVDFYEYNQQYEKIVNENKVLKKEIENLKIEIQNFNDTLSKYYKKGYEMGLNSKDLAVNIEYEENRP